MHWVSGLSLVTLIRLILCGLVCLRIRLCSLMRWWKSEIIVSTDRDLRPTEKSAFYFEVICWTLSSFFEAKIRGYQWDHTWGFSKTGMRRSWPAWICMVLSKYIFVVTSPIFFAYFSTERFLIAKITEEEKGYWDCNPLVPPFVHLNRHYPGI